MERHDKASYEARATAAASEELIIPRDTAALSEGAYTREMAASSARMAVRQGAVDDEVTRLLACEAESDRCGRGLVGSFALLLLGRALRLAAAARRIRDAVRQRFRIEMLVQRDVAHLYRMTKESDGARAEAASIRAVSRWPTASQ